jgi:hypothetical protein
VNGFARYTEHNRSFLHDLLFCPGLQQLSGVRERASKWPLPKDLKVRHLAGRLPSQPSCLLLIAQHFADEAGVGVDWRSLHVSALQMAL